jgi:hypothetical protein
MPGLPLWPCIGPKTPPGSMVTLRIRSWRPAMPSISGPRSTVASNSAVTPLVSGCRLFVAHRALVSVLPGPNVRFSTWDELISDTRSHLCRRQRQPALISRYFQAPTSPTPPHDPVGYLPVAVVSRRRRHHRSGGCLVRARHSRLGGFHRRVVLNGHDAAALEAEHADHRAEVGRPGGHQDLARRRT